MLDELAGVSILLNTQSGNEMKITHWLFTEAMKLIAIYGHHLCRHP